MAFKPRGAQAAPPEAQPPLPPEDPTDRSQASNDEGPVASSVLDAFVASFGKDIERQLRRMIKDALESITKSKAFFREDDVAGRVKVSAQKEWEHRTDILEYQPFDEVVAALIREQDLVHIGTSRFRTTREMAEVERMVIDLAGAQTPDHVLPEEVVNKALAACKGISEEQTAATLAATRTTQRVTTIEGAAGAGKSFTMKSIKDAYVARGYKVMGTALGWNAAKVLEASAGLADCVAIEGLVRQMQQTRASGVEFFRQPTLLIVDEAGMVGARHMKALLEETAASRMPVKVVLTGDSLQVNPVDAGNSLEAIIAYHGTTRIDTIRRQAQESHRVAVKQFSKREAGKALHTHLHQEAIHFAADKETMFNLVVRDFVSYKRAFPEKKALILALANKDVVTLNRIIRRAYKRAGFVEAAEVPVQVTDGRESWESGFSVGDEVVLRANSKDLTVYDLQPDTDWSKQDAWKVTRQGAYNRNSGKVVAIRRSKDPAGSFDFMIDMGGDTPGRIVVNSVRFKNTDSKCRGMPMVHNFATTVYASQGQTVDHVFILDSEMMEFRLAYVGMSRHKGGVDVYLDETDLHHRMDRLRGLGSRQDRRGPQPPTQLGRYRRSEMLQAVARVWAKESENLTVTMLEKGLRLGRPEMPPIDELAKLQPGLPADKLLDWPAGQVRPPRVDIEKLLALPEPVVEQGVVAPSAVDAVENDWQSPTRWVPHEHRLPTAPAPKEEESLWGAAKRWLGGGKGDPLTTVAKEKASQMVEAVRDTIQRVTEGPQIPLAPEPPPAGSVLPDGTLSFEGIPGVTPGEGPSAEFLADTKGKLWDLGRYGEPRILATRGAQVMARYRFDGTCVVGEGYPPLFINTQAPADNPVYIVPGAREWLWFIDHQQRRQANDPTKVPHAMWWGKDMDIDTTLAKALSQRPLRIARSRTDDGQIPWALDVQRVLKEKWGIDAPIIPEVPSPASALDKRRPGP